VTGLAAGERPVTWSRLQRSLGLLVLLLGGILRFAYLDHGLRHLPHTDENYFVEPAARIRASGRLDPGWHQYPGLMFYVLLPLVAPAEGHDAPGPDAYLAARRLIASCGVLALALAIPLGRRLVGPWGTLLAVALLAVSPVHVETAHSLRPDVVLECLTLLLFLALLRLDGRPRRDLQAGAALGLAMGLKYSAILSAVPLLLARLAIPKRRGPGLLITAAAASLVFFLCSPYMLWNWDGFWTGILTQVGYHYQEQPATLEPYASRLLTYASVWPKALGWPATLLAAAGLVVAMRSQPRRFLPFVALPPLTVAVFATSGYFFNRHLVPSMSVVALLAGLALETLRRRGRRGASLALALAVAAPVPTLLATVHYLRSIGRPSTFDRAADWVSARVPGPARVLTDQPRLGFPTRFEVLRMRREQLDAATLELLLPEVQAVVSAPLPEGAHPDALRAATVARPPGNPWGGPTLELRLGRPAETRPVELAAARLSASASGEQLENLRDGDLGSYWEVEAQRGQVEWIEVELPRAVTLARVELMLGSRPQDAGRGLRVKVALPGAEYVTARSVSVRPATRDQNADVGGYSERLALQPVPARFVRIERSAGARRWSVAELRLEAAIGPP